jgi:hypothetical protein
MCNLELTAIHNPGSMPVEMEGCEEVHFKVHATNELPTTELPPIDNQRYIQAAYGNKYVGVSTDTGYSNSSKKLGKKVCVTKQLIGSK